MILYRAAVELDERHDPAAAIEDLFESNEWSDTWRDGIYDYVHYHSRIHEVLGIARGKGRVRFGNKGRIFALKAGDVAILLAGTGHQCLSVSGNTNPDSVTRKADSLYAKPDSKTCNRWLPLQNAELADVG